jgi:hypothetical protein
MTDHAHHQRSPAPWWKCRFQKCWRACSNTSRSLGSVPTEYRRQGWVELNGPDSNIGRSACVPVFPRVSHANTSRGGPLLQTLPMLKRKKQTRTLHNLIDLVRVGYCRAHGVRDSIPEEYIRYTTHIQSYTYTLSLHVDPRPRCTQQAAQKSNAQSLRSASAHIAGGLW